MAFRGVEAKLNQLDFILKIQREFLEFNFSSVMVLLLGELPPPPPFGKTGEELGHAERVGGGGGGMILPIKILGHFIIGR